MLDAKTVAPFVDAAFAEDDCLPARTERGTDNGPFLEGDIILRESSKYFMTGSIAAQGP